MLVRCDNHDWPQSRGDYEYVARVEPLDAPNHAIICGLCGDAGDPPGDLYLNAHEYYDYEYDGKRTFSPPSKKILAIEVSDNPVEVKEDLTRDEDNPPDDDSPDEDPEGDNLDEWT